MAPKLPGHGPDRAVVAVSYDAPLLSAVTRLPPVEPPDLTQQVAATSAPLVPDASLFDGQPAPEPSPLNPSGGLPPTMGSPSDSLAPALPSCEGRCAMIWTKTWHDVAADYRRFYSAGPLIDLAAGFGIGAAFANTPLDQHVRDWYQDQVRNSGTDRVATVFKQFGEGKYVIPACAGLFLVGEYWQERPALGLLGEFGQRATRAYLVGAPPMLLMQYVTGASRPEENSWDSRWRPFNDTNGVSGHAFMGAVPFITAAQMTDNLVAKGSLYVLSTFTAWSRVNDDCHYLSQVGLGWWMAYIACRTVNENQSPESHLTFSPVANGQMTGVGMDYRW